MPRGPYVPRQKMGWLLIAVSSLVVVAGIVSALLLLVSPTPKLALNGGSNVLSGGSLHLHGSGFTPGANVTLMLDNSIPVVAEASNADKGASEEPQREAAAALGLLFTEQLQSPTTSRGAIIVSSAGTFDVPVLVSESWQLGFHMISATEDTSSRSAELMFHILPRPAQLTVRPAVVDLSNLPGGTKIIVAVLVGNSGGQRLNWAADTRGVAWLTLQTSSGAIEPSTLNQPIYVTVDTNHLKAGSYSAPLSISSNGGEAQVEIKFTVVAQIPNQVAKLEISRSSLDFGAWQAGNSVTLQLAISNVGTQQLHWKVDAGFAGWLTLDRNAGMIQAGGLPQTIYLTALTTGLAAGNYSTVLHVSSDGGDARIAVTLVVTPAPLPQPQPPTATPTPPKLYVSSGHLQAYSDCSYAQGQSWMCVETLSSHADAHSKLAWSATSNLPGILFYPSGGTLSPGQSAQVNVVIGDTTCPANATLTFAGPANSVDVPWSCPPPHPILNVSPLSFNGNTDCNSDFNNLRDWHCTVTLHNEGAHGTLDWSASGSQEAGISFNPPSGTLSPGQSMQVGITLDTPCPASATFSFTGPENSILVPWSCSRSRLKIDAHLNKCTYHSTRGWLCEAIVLSNQANQGGLTWNSSSSGISGAILDFVLRVRPLSSQGQTIAFLCRGAVMHQG